MVGASRKLFEKVIFLNQKSCFAKINLLQIGCCCCVVVVVGPQ